MSNNPTNLGTSTNISHKPDLGRPGGGSEKKTNGRGGVKGIEDCREYPVVRENQEQQLNLHAPNLSPGKRLYIFFVLSRGGEKR
jgi:hypothetical protein